MDTLNEFERNQTVYTLNVYMPLQPPRRCIPTFLTSKRKDYSQYIPQCDSRIGLDELRKPIQIFTSKDWHLMNIKK